MKRRETTIRLIAASLAFFSRYTPEARGDGIEVKGTSLQEITVLLSLADKVCKVASPVNWDHPDYKVRVRSKEEVQWRFINDCSQDVDVTIGRFKPSPRYKYDNDTKTVDPSPVEKREYTTHVSKAGGVSSKVKVKEIQQGTREATTYSYAICVGHPEKPACTDPEIEIPKP